DPAPASEVAPRLGEISLRHVDADCGKPRPRLFDELEKSPGAAADVDEPQPTLIASGEDLMERQQRLTAGGVGGAVEQHFHLSVVAPRRFARHPATRLIVEILQIIIRTLGVDRLAE